VGPVVCRSGGNSPEGAGMTVMGCAARVIVIGFTGSGKGVGFVGTGAGRGAAAAAAIVNSWTELKIS
jgi:hypothetical protein